MNSIKVISQLWFSEGKGNYLGMTSRKVFNIGNPMHASLWKEKMSEGWKGTTIDSHVVPHQQGHQEAVALSIRNCRKWQKTLPVSQLPCSLEAGYCQGALGRPASLQKLIICQTLMSSIVLEEEWHAPYTVQTSWVCLNSRTYILPELCASTTPVTQKITNTSNLIM